MRGEATDIALQPSRNPPGLHSMSSRNRLAAIATAGMLAASCTCGLVGSLAQPDSGAGLTDAGTAPEADGGIDAGFDAGAVPDGGLTLVNGPPPASVKVYEKYELKFRVATTAQHPFFEYDPTPPAGVTPGTGVTVEGFIQTPSGSKVHPAFFATRVSRANESTTQMTFTEQAETYWVLRFSPQEVGTHSVSIRVTDKVGLRTFLVGDFTATAPTRPGFVRVARADPRYFEHSNGEIYWPIGPAWNRNNDYSRFKDSGQTLDRPWMGGLGLFSGNWARWWSSSEEHGNEGVATRLDFAHAAPGSELSYPLFHSSNVDGNPADGANPNGFRMWLTGFLNDFYTPLKADTSYRVEIVFKAANITGPRNAARPEYGFVVRHSDYWWPCKAGDPGCSASQSNSANNTDAVLAARPKLVDHQKSTDPATNGGWKSLVTTVRTGPDVGSDLFLYLDNVTAGEVFIDTFSIKEVLADSSLGGEVIRNPKADIHTYVDPRAAEFIDWQVEQGEKYGVFFKYVVHDKNDPVIGHMRADGTWTQAWGDSGDGYYQPENTKARWTLRQWYRYLVARWGYSTAIHSWELNNEGPPNDDPAGSGTSPHWRTAQAFARYIKSIDAHPHLATTSFWCCWRPGFWGNSTSFGDVDYADLHEYTQHGEPNPHSQQNAYDLAMWNFETALEVYKVPVSKPILRGETGLEAPDLNLLTAPNTGAWYHNLLWVQLSHVPMFDPGYWSAEHVEQGTTAIIDKQGISKPFHAFVKSLDVHKGGFSALGATSSEPGIRVFGQKNLSKKKAVLWLQNAAYDWKNISPAAKSGSVSWVMNPSTTYTATWVDTRSGGIVRSDPLVADAAGAVSLPVSNLVTDVAVRIEAP